MILEIDKCYSDREDNIWRCFQITYDPCYPCRCININTGIITKRTIDGRDTYSNDMIFDENIGQMVYAHYQDRPEDLIKEANSQGSIK